MPTVSVIALRQAANSRRPGYFDAVMAAAASVDGDTVVLTDAAYAAIQAEYGRRGLGDAVAAGLQAIGITEERVSRLTGSPCNCQQRIAALNRAGDAIVAAITGNRDTKRG